MPLRAAAATLRSIAAHSNSPSRGSTRSYAISKRSDSTPERRIVAPSAARFTDGASRTPFTMTPKNAAGAVRAAAAPGAASTSTAATSPASGAIRRMAAILLTGVCEQRRRVAPERVRRRVERCPPRLRDLGRREAYRRAAGRRREAVQERALVAAGHLRPAREPQVGELDPELLAHLAPHARLRCLAAPQAAARQLPGAAIAVRVADEQHAAPLVAHDALDALRARAAHEPPRAQARVGGAVAEALQPDRAAVRQVFARRA